MNSWVYDLELICDVKRFDELDAYTLFVIFLNIQQNDGFASNREWTNNLVTSFVGLTLRAIIGRLIIETALRSGKLN